MSRTDSTHKCAECGRVVDTLYYTPDTGWLCTEHFMTRWLPTIFEPPTPPKKQPTPCLCGCGRIPPEGFSFFEDACLSRGLERARELLNGQRFDESGDA